MDEKERNLIIENRIKDGRQHGAMYGAILASCLILGPLGFVELSEELEYPSHLLIFVPVFIYLTAKKLWGDAVRPFEPVGRWPTIYNIAASIMMLFAFAGAFSVLNDMGKSRKLDAVCGYIEDTAMRTQLRTQMSAYQKEINTICKY